MPHKLDIDYLIQLKEDQNLTMQEISDISGVPIGSIKRILSGNTENPCAVNIADMIEALGGSMDDAYGIRISNSTIHTNQQSTVSDHDAFEEALKASRSAYQNAYDSVKSAYADQFETMKIALKDKNRWIACVFTYAVLITLVLLIYIELN